MLKNTKYKIETKDGYIEFDGIVKHEKQQLFKVVLEDNSFIEVTYKHVFVIDGIEKMFNELNIGDFLETKTGLKMICDIKPTKIDYVYDLINIQNKTKTFYANGILNHNCDFLGSSSTLIDGESLQRMTSKEPIMSKYGYLLKLYELPQDGVFYILGADASKGIGQDYATVQVLRVDNEREVEQVAVYSNNKIDPYSFAQVVIEISKLYNEAPILIENNGEGGQVIDAIWHQFEYDKVVNFEKKGLGVRASVKTKLSACLILKRYIENGWLQLHDKETIKELTFFEEKTENVFKATGSQHDDLVASLFWALYFLQTNQYDGYGNTIHNIEDKFKLRKDEDDDNAAGICIFDG